MGRNIRWIPFNSWCSSIHVYDKTKLFIELHNDKIVSWAPTNFYWHIWFVCDLQLLTLNTLSLLTVDAARYVDKALSCGYTGLVMLHGMMNAGYLSSWYPRLYANYHPSYYGMMVASFIKTVCRAYIEMNLENLSPSQCYSKFSFL
jgi:hypothetical protein